MAEHNSEPEFETREEARTDKCEFLDVSCPDMEALAASAREYHEAGAKTKYDVVSQTYDKFRMNLCTRENCGQCDTYQALKG